MAENHPSPLRTDRQAFPAVNPANGSTFDVYITMRRAEWVAKRGQGAVWEMAHTVTEVLRTPSAIHEGIRWDEDEDRGCDQNVDSWLCYSHRPAHYYDPKSGRKLPSDPDDVFLVFVNKDRVAYHWRWDRADDDGSGMPSGHLSRFRKKVL